MRSLKKKLTVLLAAATLVCSAASLASCADNKFTAPKDADTSADNVQSNGGFVVETGDYVYFINGEEEASADNTYGNVRKGALYRIAKNALNEKSYDKAECVVPSLFVAQNYDGGVFIYDDYVYFASPTTEKEKDGSVSASWLSFKKVKLDGTSTKKEADKYLFRLSDNSVSYRFVKGSDGVVYCMYVQNNNLYSFNTATGVTALLVAGAENYYFDTEKLDNGYVYYLMKVPAAMTADASEFGYNQLYRVAADATASMDADNAAYTVKDGAGAEYRTYKFDKASLVKNNADFDGGDLSQYPYVNLGKLVLDGWSSFDKQGSEKSDFNDSEENNTNAYTYAVLSYKNGRVLLTRTGSPSETTTAVYTFKDEQIDASWHTVKANKEKLFYVSDDTTNASASAVYYEAGENLAYLYVADGYINRSVVKPDGTFAEEKVALAEPGASSPTLWKTQGEYLYYYAAGDSGNNLYRLKYDGAEAEYRKNLLIGNEKNRDAQYMPAKILNVQYNDSWYKPEFAGSTLFYCNSQSFGSKSFDYIYTVDLKGSGADGMMTAAELKAYNEKYEAVTEYFDGLSDTGDDGADLKLTLQYCFRADELTAYDELLADAKEQGYKDHYRYGEYAQAEIAAFRNHTAHGENDFATKFKDENGKYYDRESYFINRVGEMTDADKDEIASIWRKEFVKPLPDLSTDNGGWSTSKKVLVTIAIVAGSLAVIIGVTLPIVISHKKKAKRAADLEATRVRKPKIDTTDDKSIDVYATEEKTEEAAEETANDGAAEVSDGAEETGAEVSEENADNAENKEE